MKINPFAAAAALFESAFDAAIQQGPADSTLLHEAATMLYADDRITLHQVKAHRVKLLADMLDKDTSKGAFLNTAQALRGRALAGKGEYVSVPRAELFTAATVIEGLTTISLVSEKQASVDAEMYQRTIANLAEDLEALESVGEQPTIELVFITEGSGLTPDQAMQLLLHAVGVR